MRLLLACAFAVFMCTAANAQTTRDELSDSFRTCSAKIDLKTRTDLARHVEAAILQQSRFLSAQLHPWEKDPTASVLFKGTSTENDIRSNAHLAYGLASIARAIPDASAAADAKRQSIAILLFLLQT